MVNNKDFFNDTKDDFKDIFDDSFNDSESFKSWSPTHLDGDTFRQRNDPTPLLEAFKLKLMNAYEEIEEEKDSYGGTRKIKKIKFKKNTQPLCNKQGVEEIMRYIESTINRHSVQGYIIDVSNFNHNMQFIADDIVTHFIGKRRDWGMSVSDCDVIISNTTNMCALFLSRLIGDKERIHYGDSFQERTTVEKKAQTKGNIFQQLGGFLSGGNKR